MKGKSWMVVWLLAFLFALALVSEMDYQDEVKLADQGWWACVRSMGAETDMEIVQAIDTCRRRMNYQPKGVELP